VRRSGDDVTIAGAMRAVDLALEAADVLSGRGIEADVLDLRTLRPLDATAIADSVARTRRLVVVEEGPPTGGYAADVVATAVERVGPVAARRVTMADLPIPFSPTLEDAALPSAEAVVAAVEALGG
jgi:pyruvate/2-oxoglutarate/acetoin dehydrogenase E1 component